MRILAIFLVFILIGCSQGKGEFVPDDSWTEKDSVKCWAIQLANYYQHESWEFTAAETQYGRLYLQFNQSLFKFDYPCQFMGAQELEFRGGTVKLFGKDQGEWSFDGDALFIVKDHPSKKEHAEEVYLPVLMETAELKHLMTIERHPGCEKDSSNQYFTDYQRKLFNLHKTRAQTYFNHLNM